MKKIVGIIVCCLVLPYTAAAMTVEQRQRFLYYFYEAERLWQAEQFADAYSLFDYCHTLNPTDAITNRYLGHVYMGCDLPTQALPYYRQAWLAAPAECWKDYAILLYNTNEADNRAEAIKVMEQTTQYLPQDADLWEHLRDAYIGAREFKKALTAQDQLDKAVGYSAYSAINRYRIYVYMQKPKLAIAAIEQYLKEDPTNLQFLLYRIQLYESTGAKVKQLVPMYKEVLRLDPYNALILNNYAYLLATQKGDLTLAEKMSTKALQIEPANPIYLDTYAWILHLSGQNELAKLYIRQAVQQVQGQAVPKDIQNHYNIIYQQ